MYALLDPKGYLFKDYRSLWAKDVGNPRFDGDYSRRNVDFLKHTLAIERLLAMESQERGCLSRTLGLAPLC